MAGVVQLAVIFLILALIFFISGMKGIAGFSMKTAQWFVLIFVVVAIIMLVL
jgi:uncharacterized membrane protein YtjA (UPF0391 family)